jgi:RNA 2',3'-cyclic 3'-phosphodiesterase
MRVFIAVDLPDQVRNNMGEVERDLKGVSNSARWVAPESIHVTLKFIGEIPEARVAAIDSALAAIQWPSFPVIVRGVGCFPNNHAARVFWVGLESPALAGLAGEIDRRMQELGFEKEQRPFRPHLTLARARDMRIDRSLVVACERFLHHDFGSFEAERFHLFQSTLKPSGAVYNKLKQYPLEPRSA